MRPGCTLKRLEIWLEERRRGCTACHLFTVVAVFCRAFRLGCFTHGGFVQTIILTLTALVVRGPTWGLPVLRRILPGAGCRDAFDDSLRLPAPRG